MGTKDDIKAMLDSFGAPGDADDEVKTDPPSTDPPIDDVQTDPPADPVTDEPETDAPTTDEPNEGDDDKFSELMKKNQELEDKLKALDKKDEPPKTEAPTTDPPIKDLDFSEYDLDDLSRDPEAFNKVLNTVYKKAVETVRGEYKALGQKTFEAIPQEVDRTLTTKQTLKELTDKFYKNNDDLKPWSKTVGVVFDEVIAENPGTEFGEALDKTATIVRERIGIDKTNSRKKGNDDKPPPLHRKKGKRSRPKPKEQGKFSSEIDEMNQALNS